MVGVGGMGGALNFFIKSGRPCTESDLAWPRLHGKGAAYFAPSTGNQHVIAMRSNALFQYMLLIERGPRWNIVGVVS